MAAQKLFPITLWTAQDLDNDGVLTSSVIPCITRVPDVLMFRVTHTSGAPNVKIEIAISNDGTNFNLVTSQPPISASTNTEFGSYNPQAYHALVVLPVAPWIKIVVTEISAANLDNNVVDATLWVREL
jgi:hypothetical protein